MENQELTLDITIPSLFDSLTLEEVHWYHTFAGFLLSFTVNWFLFSLAYIFVFSLRTSQLLTKAVKLQYVMQLVTIAFICLVTPATIATIYLSCKEH